MKAAAAIMTHAFRTLEMCTTPIQVLHTENGPKAQLNTQQSKQQHRMRPCWTSKKGNTLTDPNGRTGSFIVVISIKGIFWSAKFALKLIDFALFEATSWVLSKGRTESTV